MKYLCPPIVRSDEKGWVLLTRLSSTLVVFRGVDQVALQLRSGRLKVQLVLTTVVPLLMMCLVLRRWAEAMVLSGR